MAPRSPLTPVCSLENLEIAEKRVSKVTEVLRKYDPQENVKITISTKFGSLRQEKTEQ